MTQEKKFSLMGDKVTHTWDQALTKIYEAIDGADIDESIDLVQAALMYVLQVAYKRQAHGELLLDFLVSTRMRLEKFAEEEERQEKIANDAREEHARLVEIAKAELAEKARKIH